MTWLTAHRMLAQRFTNWLKLALVKTGWLITIGIVSLADAINANGDLLMLIIGCLALIAGLWILG